MNFRKAELSDTDELMQLGLQAYGEYFPQLSPDNKSLMESSLSKPNLYLDMLNCGTGFVSVHQNKIIGMGFIIRSGNPTAIYPADWSYIRLIGILPEWKGKGIASRITQLCIEEAKQNNEKVIGLHTSEMMPAARHIYEKLGFTIYKDLENIFGKKYWLYQYKLID